MDITLLAQLRDPLASNASEGRQVVDRPSRVLSLQFISPQTSQAGSYLGRKEGSYLPTYFTTYLCTKQVGTMGAEGAAILVLVATPAVFHAHVSLSSSSTFACRCHCSHEIDNLPTPKSLHQSAGQSFKPPGRGWSKCTTSPPQIVPRCYSGPTCCTVAAVRHSSTTAPKMLRKRLCLHYPDVHPAPVAPITTCTCKCKCERSSSRVRFEAETPASSLFPLASGFWRWTRPLCGKSFEDATIPVPVSPQNMCPSLPKPPDPPRPLQRSPRPRAHPYFVHNSRHDAGAGAVGQHRLWQKSQPKQTTPKVEAPWRHRGGTVEAVDLFPALFINPPPPAFKNPGDLHVHAQGHQRNPAGASSAQRPGAGELEGFPLRPCPGLNHSSGARLQGSEASNASGQNQSGLAVATTLHPDMNSFSPFDQASGWQWLAPELP
ncbi:hypothetical protein B0T10DRAFT_457656 [Thelonectria olida]|uniref:Uncharacterized protein n=1 Tax=Thelonectria olida TaxID=1576542 RepID=A0A9P8W966_9HYPO|nr:hypothetical protein B0T10DRAFT_457656 [Thelonectria olida]